MFGCVGRLLPTSPAHPGVVWPSLPGRATVCAAALSCAPGSARIVPCPRKAPPHRDRSLPRRRTTEPCSLFVSNLHTSRSRRDSSHSALFECRNSLIGGLFAGHGPAAAVPVPARDSRRTSMVPLAEIDSVVLHPPHSMRRRAHSPTRSKPRRTRGRAATSNAPANNARRCADHAEGDSSQTWRTACVKVARVTNDSMLRHVRSVQLHRSYFLRHANSEG